MSDDDIIVENIIVGQLLADLEHERRSARQLKELLWLAAFANGGKLNISINGMANLPNDWRERARLRNFSDDRDLIWIIEAVLTDRKATENG